MNFDLVKPIQHRVAKLCQTASDNMSGQRSIMPDDTKGVVSSQRNQQSAIPVAEGLHSSSNEPCGQLAGEMSRLLACDLRGRRQRPAGARCIEPRAVSEREDTLIRERLQGRTDQELAHWRHAEPVQTARKPGAFDTRGPYDNVSLQPPSIGQLDLSFVDRGDCRAGQYVNLCLAKPEIGRVTGNLTMPVSFLRKAIHRSGRADRRQLSSLSFQRSTDGIMPERLSSGPISTVNPRVPHALQ